MLKREEKAFPRFGSGIGVELIKKLMNLNHSGFSVHAGNRIARDARQEQKSLPPYALGIIFCWRKHHPPGGNGEMDLLICGDEKWRYLNISSILKVRAV
jgi:hypothetical protein